MAPENLDHNEGIYAIAIQLGDYRAACHQAIRAMRRAGRTDLWKMRLRGCLARRLDEPPAGDHRPQRAERLTQREESVQRLTVGAHQL